MECKDLKEFIKRYFVFIRIYPEWNVKKVFDKKRRASNVKSSTLQRLQGRNTLEYDQNGM